MRVLLNRSSVFDLVFSRGQSTLVGPIARGSSRFPAQGELGGKEAMVPQIISKSAVIKRVREERNRILFSALNTEK